MWGEINIWAKERVLGHGWGSQKKTVSSANPRQRVSSLLQGKGSGDMDFLRLPKCFYCAPNLVCPLSPQRNVEVPWRSAWFVCVLNIGPDKLQRVQLTLELPLREKESVSCAYCTLTHPPAHARTHTFTQYLMDEMI